MNKNYDPENRKKELPRPDRGTPNPSNTEEKIKIKPPHEKESQKKRFS